MRSDFGNYAGNQTNHRFGPQVFEMASSVLDFVKHALNPLTDAIEQAVEASGMLDDLVHAFGRDDTITGLVLDLGLPFLAQKAFVTKSLSIGQAAQDGFSGLAFLNIGWDQFLEHGQPIQSGHHDQLVAIVMPLTAGAITIGRAAREVAVFLATLVADHRDRFGIQQKMAAMFDPQLHQPLTPPCFHQQPQPPRSTVKLALIHQLRKHSQMVSSNVAHKLLFPWIRYEVLRQHQRHHLTVTEAGRATDFALQQLLPFTLIPVIVST